MSHAAIKAFGSAMGRSTANSVRAMLNEIKALVDFFMEKCHQDKERFKSKLAFKALLAIIHKMLVKELSSRSTGG